ncbi:MAG: response regulator [Candidatus Hermodarchaeota archaeon]
MEFNIKVLHIDDEEDFLELAKFFLEDLSSKIVIESLSSPYDALERLKTQIYDVIISDYQMPDLNGLELLSKLRKKGNYTPFIILTGRGREEVVIKALNLGADYYLQKGQDSESLFTELLNIIQKEAEKKREQEKLRETEKQIQELRQILANRFNDLNFLYAVSQMISEVGELEDVVFQEVVQMIPHTFQFPDICCTRIRLGNKEYKTQSFQESIWELKTEILAKKGKIGEVQVYYLEEKPIRDEGVFLNAEMALINALARELGKFAERVWNEKALEYHRNFESLVTNISTKFINLLPDKIDEELSNALQKIGEFAEVDRSYVFLFRNKGTIMDNTYEWCAEGIEPQILNLQGLSCDDFPWWMERLRQFENIHIPRVIDLPAEATAEKKVLQSRATQSFIVVPMIYRKTLIGFLGFDSARTEKRWAEDSITLLRIIGEIFTNALIRKWTEEDAQRMQRMTTKLFYTLSEGVVILDEDGFEILDCNPAITEIFGYGRQEIIGQRLDSLYADETVREKFGELLYTSLEEKGYLVLPKFQMKRKDGTIFLAEYSLIPLDDDQGKTIRWISKVRELG